jgi:hypothetical protein
MRGFIKFWSKIVGFVSSRVKGFPDWAVLSNLGITLKIQGQMSNFGLELILRQFPTTFMLKDCPKSEAFGSGMKHKLDLVQGKENSKGDFMKNKVSVQNNFILLIKSYYLILKVISYYDIVS